MQTAKPTLLITCSSCPVCFEDLLPEFSVFAVSNLGNIVPPFSATDQNESAASIEYALASQDARRIIVCGHSDCSVLKNVLLCPPVSAAAVNKWLHYAPRVPFPTTEKATEEILRELVEANVVLQMEHLKTYPEVARRVMSGDLAIDGWVLREDIGLVAEYHAERKAFLLRITQKIVPATPTRPN